MLKLHLICIVSSMCFFLNLPSPLIYICSFISLTVVTLSRVFISFLLNCMPLIIYLAVFRCYRNNNSCVAGFPCRGHHLPCFMFRLAGGLCRRPDGALPHGVRGPHRAWGGEDGAGETWVKTKVTHTPELIETNCSASKVGCSQGFTYSVL